MYSKANDLTEISVQRLQEVKISTIWDNPYKRVLIADFAVAVTVIACTKPYYFDVADDSRVSYVEKDFLSKVHDEVHCLHYDKSKRQVYLTPQGSFPR